LQNQLVAEIPIRFLLTAWETGKFYPRSCQIELAAGGLDYNRRHS